MLSTGAGGGHAAARAAMVVVLALLLAVPSRADAGHARTRLDPPVAGSVLAGFHHPTTYGAGHRGVDLGAPAGTPVRASAGGLVTFAGTVVGQRWVTVDHGDVRTTVGSLARVDVARGQRVVRGQVLGTLAAAHGLAARVHWSARVGDTYVDPRTAHRLVATLLPGGAPPTVGAGSSTAGAAVRWPWVDAA